MAFEEYSRAFGSDSRLGGLNRNDSAVNSGPSFARNKSESFFWEHTIYLTVTME